MTPTVPVEALWFSRTGGAWDLLRKSDLPAIGTVEQWPSNLAAVVQLVLQGTAPAALFWGRDRILLYNDAYMHSAAADPAAFGSPYATDALSLGPSGLDLLDRAYAGSPASGGAADSAVAGRSGPGAAGGLSFLPIFDADGSVAGVFHSVSDDAVARRTEAALRDSEERLLLAVENADLATWELDLVADKATRTLRHDQMFGYREQQPEWGLAIAERHILEEDLPVFRDAWSRAMATGEFACEFRVRWQDGTLHWVSPRGRVRYDARGTPVRMSGVVQDVTAAKQAEAALLAGRLEMQQLMDALPVLISYIDRDRRYRFVNKGYQAWFGRPRDEIVGRYAPEVIGEAAYELVRGYLDRTFAGETVTFERVMPYAGGKPRHIRVQYVPRMAPSGEVEGVYALVEDVSAARRSEEAARTSEERFRGVFDSDLMGFTIFDVNTVETLAVNDAFLAMTGHDRSDFESGRWDWKDFTVPEHLHLDEAAIAQARARGRWDPYEKEYIHRDGTRFPVRISSAPLGDVPGRVIVSIQDVTEQRKAEAELRASERRLQLAKHAAGIGIWDWDLASNEITWSEEMFKLLGVPTSTPPDRLFHAWAETLHPDDRERAVEIAAAGASTGKAFSMDVRIVDGDGGIRWIRSQAVSVLDDAGKPVRLTGVNIDVTAQHTIEESLRSRAEIAEAAVRERTRERNRMFELSSDLFTVGGFDGYLRSVNAAWREVLGYEEGELLSTPILDLVHPDDRKTAQRVLGSLGEGRSQTRIELRLVARDGVPRTIEWTAVPERDLFYAVGRDVTHDREREAVLRQTQKMDAVGQLTGGLAHDFNNLLGAVMSGFDLILRKPDDAARVAKIAANGLDAAERGARLTGQLLAFSRAQRLERRPTDVSEVVRGMQELLSRTIGPEIMVELDLRAVDVSVNTDPIQIEMAVLNLAINGRDAMPDGGRITIRTVTLELAEDPELPSGDYVALSVTDTGNGMVSEVASRAFDPFFTTKGVGKGTGLGLSQVYGVARQTGGVARIESAEGRGTTVTLLLPAVPGGTAGDADAPVPGPAAQIGGARVLVIDDDADLRRMLFESLAALGYEVVAAEDGATGLDMLSHVDPDVVLVDFAMPGMNGADVAEAIRRRRPGLPVVFASGHADTAAIEKAMGPDAVVLRKPFRLDVLGRTISDAVRGSGRAGSPGRHR